LGGDTVDIRVLTDPQLSLASVSDDPYADKPLDFSLVLEFVLLEEALLEGLPALVVPAVIQRYNIIHVEEDDEPFVDEEAAFVSSLLNPIVRRVCANFSCHRRGAWRRPYKALSRSKQYPCCLNPFGNGPYTSSSNSAFVNAFVASS
jgi:hypothetical protein